MLGVMGATSFFIVARREVCRSGVDTVSLVSLEAAGYENVIDFSSIDNILIFYS